MADKILIIEDDSAYAATLKRTLELNGYSATVVANSAQAMRICEQNLHAAILLDIKLPGSDGFEVLERLRHEYPAPPVVMMTQEPSYEKAVRAIKLGAFDFIPKEILDRDRLLVTLHNAIEKARMQSERTGLLHALQSQRRMIGTSRPMRDLKDQLERVAHTQERVLIVGESGSGKELVAHAIYSRSTRAAQPYVKVNCAAIPKDLIESELFGHRKGSFTGAVQDHAGKFKAADSGTIFLDQVEDMSLDVQAKVLRTLQEGEIEPVGGHGPEHVDVRTLAATRKDLKAMVNEGTFREDLYYRLRTIQLNVPPLRERMDDIPVLLEYLLQQAAERNNRPTVSAGPAALTRLLAYGWPGNVRELDSFASWVSVYVTGDELLPRDFDSWLGVEAPSAGGRDGLESYWDAKLTFEREYFQRLLISVDGNISAAARAADLDRAGLYRKLKALGLPVE